MYWPFYTLWWRNPHKTYVMSCVHHLLHNILFLDALICKHSSHSYIELNNTVWDNMQKIIIWFGRWGCTCGWVISHECILASWTVRTPNRKSCVNKGMGQVGNPGYNKDAGQTSRKNSMKNTLPRKAAMIEWSICIWQKASYGSSRRCFGKVLNAPTSTK